MGGRAISQVLSFNPISWLPWLASYSYYPIDQRQFYSFVVSKRGEIAGVFPLEERWLHLGIIYMQIIRANVPRKFYLNIPVEIARSLFSLKIKKDNHFSDYLLLLK